MAFAANDTSKFAETLTSTVEQANAMTTAYVNAATKSSTAAWQGIEELTRDVTATLQDSYARSVSAFKTMLSAKSPQEAADTHAEFLKDCFDGVVASSGKLSETSMRIAKGTMEPLTQHANDTVAAVMKKVKVG